MFTPSTGSLSAGVAGVLFAAQSFAQSTATFVADPQKKGVSVENGVLHISFDKLTLGSYGEESLKKDFPTYNGIGFEPGNKANDRATIVSESLIKGGKSLKVSYPAGKLKTRDSGIDARIALAGKGADRFNNFQADELYLSYWVKFSPNFEFDKCGGKMPSLGGSDFMSAENRWKGRVMWRRNGSLTFYMELPHEQADLTGNENNDNDDANDAANAKRFWGSRTKEGKSICDYEYTSYLKSPGWHNIELHYKLDRGANGQGFFEGWVDGGKGYKKIDAGVFGFYRPKGGEFDKVTLNAILLSTFLGGSDLSDYAPTQDTYALFDEFKVSTKRVNEYAKYATSSSRATAAAGTSPAASLVATPERVALYPNPSPGGVFRLSQAVEWEVVSAIGQKVQSGRGEVIDLSGAPRGIYLIRAAGQVLKAQVE